MRNGGLVVDFRARPPTPEFLSYFIPKHVSCIGLRLGMQKQRKILGDNAARLLKLKT